MIRRKLFFISLALLFFVSEGTSQSSEISAGTEYSYFGIGFPVLNNTALERGMGIEGISFNELQSPGLANPGFWGRGSYSRATMNFDFKTFSISGSDVSAQRTLLEVGSFQAVFPISKNRLGLSVSLYPEVRSSYQTGAQEVTINNASGIDSYLFDKSGTGGVSKFEIGLGWRPTQNFSIGYAPSYAFLTERDIALNALVGDSFVNNSELETKTSGTAFAHRFGAVVTKNSLFRQNDIVTFGATLSLPTEFDAKRKVFSDKNIDGETDNVQVGATDFGEVSLPLKYGVGLTYLPNGLINASVEFKTEQWSEASYSFNLEEENSLVDRRILGAGLQYHPYRKNSDRFLSKFKYSAGIQFDNGHLNIDGDRIKTMWLSTGIGFLSPSFRSQSSFDLSLQYGIRGKTSNNLLRENIWAINLSINLTELMFFRRKLN